MTNKRWSLLLVAFLVGLALASFAVAAQESRLRLDHLNRLASTATEIVEVNLDQEALRALTKLMVLTERDKTRLENSLSGLSGVYVRGYQFDQEGQYSPNDIETVRSQLNGDWTRIAQVGGRDGSHDEVYLKYGNDEISAYTVISTKPKNICVINVVGQMKLDEIGALDREFGISNCGKWRERNKSKSR